jgi:hypothetical protein
MCLGTLRASPCFRLLEGGWAEEQKVNPERRDQALAAADAAARRLLLRVIDFRFDLEDATDSVHAGLDFSPRDLWRLRAAADVLCRTIDGLAEALWPSADGARGPFGEESEEGTEALNS